MTTSEKLDLSRLPAFSLVDIDYEAMRSAHLASLKARLADAGIAWDVDGLETDPLVISVEEITFRRMLDLQMLNDTAKGLTLAFSFGSYLDHLAATLYPDLALQRMLVTAADPATGTPAVMESDERFRRRIALAAEARSEVTPGAYVFKALSADPRVADARALNYASGLVPVGEVLVAILAAAGHEHETAEVIAIAREAIMADKVRLSSEIITVRAAIVFNAGMRATLHVRRGPDPAIVRAEALSRLTAFLAERRMIGRVLPRSGVMGALHASAVEYVDLVTPFRDVDPGQDGWVRVANPWVEIEVGS